ncbi:hypothetical protein ACFFRR_008784 [Megaselia abdita]
MSVLKSRYYENPEGTDAFGKIVATNKYAVLGGLAWGTIDVLMVTKPKGYIPIIARYTYNVGPMMGMASAFTLGTLAATNFRGKDDRLNYFIGGVCAGGVYGAWRRSVPAGAVAALFLGIAGTIKKLSKQEGWDFFPPVHHQVSGVKPHDFTLFEDRPKNWSTE